MAKNNKKPTKETAEMEKSDEVLSVVDTKKANKAKKSEEAKKTDKKAKLSKKKVNWPSFKKVCKTTGSVLVVVGVFMLATLGIDTLVSWILKLITKI